MSWRGLPGEALTFACAGAGKRGAVGRYSHFSDNHCGHLFLDEQTASPTLEGGGIERSIAVRSIGNAHLIGGARLLEEGRLRADRAATDAGGPVSMLSRPWEADRKEGDEAMDTV